MFKALILIAAITLTGVAAFQWAALFNILGANTATAAAQHWQPRIGNTIVAAILWYVWFSI